MTSGPTITNLREIERDGKAYYRFDWEAPFQSAAWLAALDGVKCIPWEEREWEPVSKRWTVLVTPENALQLSLVFSNFWQMVEAIHSQAVLPL